MTEPHEYADSNEQHERSDASEAVELNDLLSSEPDEEAVKAVKVFDAPDAEPETRSAFVQDDLRAFEQLTLAEAVGLLWREPGKTISAILDVARQPKDDLDYTDEKPLRWTAPSAVPYPTLPPRERSVVETDDQRVETLDDANELIVEHEPTLPALWVWFQLIGRGVALALAIHGASVLYSNPLRGDDVLAERFPLLFIGMIVWFVVDLITYAANRGRYVQAAAPEHTPPDQAFITGTNHLLAAGAGALCAILAYLLNGGNRFTLPGVVAWVASLVLWVWALAPAGWSPLDGVTRLWRRARTFRPRVRWTIIALIVITLFGAYFRLADLNAVPPEMTSDHVEKLLDANRVLNGQTDVFFANNHGRDAIQFYLLAGLAALGLPLNFDLLVILTVIEGIITIPLLYWLGKQLIGDDRRDLGEIVGLLMAAFVAVSYWHEMLSRLGLRIVLTPLFVALVIGFLARGLRANRRSDFLAAGVALGIGVYGYQAIRMLPVVIVVAVAIALIGTLRTWAARRAMLLNLAALALVSFVIFVPLLRYSVDYPEDFWRRTSGRLFGDDITQVEDENGNLVMRVPALSERIDAFAQNIPQLMFNLRNAALMFNWKGDVAWINNAPNHPAFDPVSGGLLLVGVGAWGVWMIRRRDAVTWSVLPLVAVMMLPSALSIAYPIENPSATRMSGTLPGVYLLVAFPAALLVVSLRRALGRFGVIAGFALVLALITYSYYQNDRVYFGDYQSSYTANALPYSTAGEYLHQFAVDEGNGYSNAFIISYPFWWDHRAVGIEAGRIDFPNSIVNLTDIPAFLGNSAVRLDEYKLDPERDLLFFFNPSDQAALEWLEANFPNGVWQNIQTYQPGKSFNVYRVPALGEFDLNEWLVEREQPPLAG